MASKNQILLAIAAQNYVYKDSYIPIIQITDVQRLSPRQKQLFGSPYYLDNTYMNMIFNN